jgi:hypothetical protein
MVFKGALPSAFPTQPSIGDTYIVNAATTLAIDGKTLEVGDLVIASGTENANGVITNPTWILVESNEIDTTYEIGTSDNKIILTSSVAGDSTEIAVNGDDAVSLTASGNNLQAAHAVIDANGLSTPNGAKVQLDYNDATGFTVVTGVTANKYGHVTGITASKIALPGTHVLAHNASTGATELKDGKAGNVVGSIDIDGAKDGVITVTSAENDGKNGTNYTVSHNKLTTTQQVKPTAPANDNATLLAHEGYFTAITDATRDAYGHVTGYTVSKYKLPADKDTTYTLSGAIAKEGTNGVKITDTLTDNVSGNTDTKSEFVLKSDNTNLTVTAAATTVTIDLVWGSF